MTMATDLPLRAGTDLPLCARQVGEAVDVTEPLRCRRCNRPVVIEADRSDVFERMHYVCFHYEFEPDPSDPDEECTARGCPSAAIHARPDRRPPTGP